MNFLGLNGLSDGTTVLFTVLMGILVVFLGMSVIIFFLFTIGKIFDGINKKEKKEKVSAKKEVALETVTESEEVDEKIKAAIVAAIYAYYIEQNANCEFKIRNIKRLKRR